MKQNVLKKNFIYVPFMRLYIAKERTHYDKNWFKTPNIFMLDAGLRRLTLFEFVNFLKYLKENPSEENNKIFKEITQKEDPWRGEWLSTCFEEKEDDLYVLTEGKKAEKLEKCLMEEKVLISLDEWMENHTSQGLPRLKNSKGELNYQCPKDIGVARFIANSGMVLLDCNANPYEGAPNLGTRLVLEAVNL